jgi:hypothetical protein
VSGDGGEDAESKSNFITVSTPNAPSANFSATPATCLAAEPVQFSDASTGQINSWTWTFGDGATSSERNPQHAYSTRGMYAVSLTVTGYGGANTETKYLRSCNSAFHAIYGQRPDGHGKRGGDPDGDPATYVYQWLKNGADLAGSTNRTLTSETGDFHVGDVLSCRVTPNDGQDDGDAVTSAPVIVMDPNDPLADSDGDGIPNQWEVLHGLNPANSADGNLDPDLDGLSNEQEYTLGTAIDDDDSDNDAMPDGWEIANSFDPTNAADAAADTDGDGVSNAQE